MVKDGQIIATEARTEAEAAEQNAALEAHCLSSRWVKWDMTERETRDLAVDHTICDPKVLPQ